MGVWVSIMEESMGVKREQGHRDGNECGLMGVKERTSREMFWFIFGYKV